MTLAGAAFGQISPPVTAADIERARQSHRMPTDAELARVPVPALAAPLDLQPKSTVVSLPLGGRTPDGLYVRVGLDGDAEEVTRLNNRRAVPPHDTESP